MSTLLKWAQNTAHSKSKQNLFNGMNNGTSTNGSPAKSWIHSPEALQTGHIAYVVKFMGNISVNQPKGIDVVKEAIRKLQFSAQLKKAETGAKTHKKVELTISMNGVAIQEPKTHIILHQFPLHSISYCADDKGEKRFFSFIAKKSSQENGIVNGGTKAEDKHECFVFISDKLAEEITLTIGQAFELAYKRFLETNGKDLEVQRRTILLQQRVKALENENNIYRQRLVELIQFQGIQPQLDIYLRKNNLKNIIEIPKNNNNQDNKQNDNDNHSDYALMAPYLNGDSKMTNGHSQQAPVVPPRQNIDLMGCSTPPIQQSQQPSVGTRLEGLLLNEFENDQDFNPRGHDEFVQMNNNNNLLKPPLLAPPPKSNKRNQANNSVSQSVSILDQDIFGSIPFIPTDTLNGKNDDPFEMGDFRISSATEQDLKNALGLLDKRLLEMNDGFSRGLSFGNDVFSLESLDPLKN